MSGYGAGIAASVRMKMAKNLTPARIESVVQQSLSLESPLPALELRVGSAAKTEYNLSIREFEKFAASSPENAKELDTFLETLAKCLASKGD